MSLLLSANGAYLQSLWTNAHNVSDVCVQIMHKDYKLHKLVLMQSPFFASAFSGRWKEVKGDEPFKVDLEFEDCSHEALDAALKTFYGFGLSNGLSVRDLLSVVSLASYFQLDALMTTCLTRFEVLGYTIENAVEVFVHLARNPLPPRMDPIINIFKTCLLLHGPKNPSHLVRLPMEILSETLNCPYLVLEGGEYERYLLVEKVIGEMKDESSSKRARTSAEGSISRQSPRLSLAHCLRFEFFTSKQLRQVRNVEGYSDGANEAVWQRNFLQGFVKEPLWAEHDVKSLRGYRYCLKIKDLKTAALASITHASIPYAFGRSVPSSQPAFGFTFGAVPLPSPDNSDPIVSSDPFEAYGCSWTVDVRCPSVVARQNIQKPASDGIRVLRDPVSDSSELCDSKHLRRRFNVKVIVMRPLDKEPVASNLILYGNPQGFMEKGLSVAECLIDGHLFIALEFCPMIPAAS
mmetsp:Transcript_31745/g.51229  ORF Transcript_31745/g.51229 Transcript_31745/m.51229 type:complete len:463 (-) Transcript_31745:510-1898(-)